MFSTAALNPLDAERQTSMRCSNTSYDAAETVAPKRNASLGYSFLSWTFS